MQEFGRVRKGGVKGTWHTSRKSQPIRRESPRVKRNGPCPCGSGSKFKNCCGKPEPPPEPVKSPYQTMEVTYTDEQKAAQEEFVLRWGFWPNPSQLMAFMEGAHEELEKSILVGMTGIGAEPKFFYAVEKLHRLVTPKNQKLISPEAAAEWEATIAEYEDGDGRGVPDAGSHAEPAQVDPEANEGAQEEAAG